MEGFLGWRFATSTELPLGFQFAHSTNSISSFDSFHSLDYKNKHYWLYCVSGLMKPRVEFWINNKNCKNINKLVSYDSSIKWFEQPNQSHQNNNTDWLLLNFNFWLQPLPPVRARTSFLIGGLGVTPQPPPLTQNRPTEWRKLLSPYYHHKTLSVARWSPVN